MKKLFYAILLLLPFTSYAHTLTNKGWCGGTYTINATLGSANGKIEVTVYTNSSMTTIVQQTGGVSPNYTITYLLNGSGAKTFTVPQSNQNVTVYVSVKWFKPNGSGGYVLDNVGWGNGTGIVNKTTNTTLLVGCTSLPIKFEYINVRSVDRETIEIEFLASDTDGEDRFNIQVSTDTRTFKTVAIVFPEPIVVNKVYKIKVKIK